MTHSFPTRRSSDLKADGTDMAIALYPKCLAVREAERVPSHPARHHQNGDDGKAEGEADPDADTAPAQAEREHDAAAKADYPIAEGRVEDRKSTRLNSSH